MSAKRKLSLNPIKLNFSSGYFIAISNGAVNRFKTSTEAWNFAVTESQDQQEDIVVDNEFKKKMKR